MADEKDYTIRHVLTLDGMFAGFIIPTPEATLELLGLLDWEYHVHPFVD